MHPPFTTHTLDRPESGRTLQAIHWLTFTGLLTVIAAADPVAAQSGASAAICNTEKLPEAIEGFFELTTGIGFLGLIVVWQADSLLELFTLSPEQRKAIKIHKRSAVRSVVIIFALGPLYTVAGPMMGLPLAECIDLVPW